jgi:hypothetical protein
VVEGLRAGLPPSARLFAWGDAAAINPHAALVTADSISMQTEMARQGLPLADVADRRLASYSGHFVLKTARIALNLLKQSLGNSEVTKGSPSRLSRAFAEGTLATEPASARQCRFMNPFHTFVHVLFQLRNHFWHQRSDNAPPPIDYRV